MVSALINSLLSSSNTIPPAVSTSIAGGFGQVILGTLPPLINDVISSIVV